MDKAMDLDNVQAIESGVVSQFDDDLSIKNGYSQKSVLGL